MGRRPYSGRGDGAGPAPGMYRAQVDVGIAIGLAAFECRCALGLTRGGSVFGCVVSRIDHGSMGELLESVVGIAVGINGRVAFRIELAQMLDVASQGIAGGRVVAIGGVWHGAER